MRDKIALLPFVSNVNKNLLKILIFKSIFIKLHSTVPFIETAENIEHDKVRQRLENVLHWMVWPFIFSICDDLLTNANYNLLSNLTNCKY